MCLATIVVCMMSGCANLLGRVTDISASASTTSAVQGDTTPCRDSSTAARLVNAPHPAVAQLSQDTTAQGPLLPGAGSQSHSEQAIAFTCQYVDDSASLSGGMPSPPSLGAVGRETLPPPTATTRSRQLGLRDVIELALMNNPDVLTARAAGPVSDAARSVAATYPWNPSVQVEAAPFARDISGNLLATRNVVTISQPLELAHQTRYRIRAAEAGWSQQQATIAQSELTASAAAMKAYFDVLYRLSLWNLAQTITELQQRAVEATERRFVAGLAAPTERMTARIAGRQAQRLTELAQVDYQAAVNGLRSVLNVPANVRLEFAPDLSDYSWRLPTDAVPNFKPATDAGTLDAPDIAPEAIAKRPDVYAARLAAVQAKANLDLARANTIPNVATGPTYERDESGTLFFGVMAQMDVPVWNTGGPLVRQRAAEYQQQLITAEQTRARALLQAQAAVQRYTLAYNLWRQHTAHGPAPSDEIGTVVDAFEHGQASFLEVLSVRDSLTQERKSELDLAHELSQAAADVVASLAIDPDLLLDVKSGDTSQKKQRGVP